MSADNHESALGETSREYLTFRVGDLLAGVPVEYVQEINRQVHSITPIPGAGSVLRGVLALRGEVVTVLDLRVLLGFNDSDLSGRSRNIVLDWEGERIAFHVDEVCDVLNVLPGSVEESPDQTSYNDLRPFTGVYKSDEIIVALLEIKNIVEGSLVEGRQE